MKDSNQLGMKLIVYKRKSHQETFVLKKMCLGGNLHLQSGKENFNANFTLRMSLSTNNCINAKQKWNAWLEEELWRFIKTWKKMTLKLWKMNGIVWLPRKKYRWYLSNFNILGISLAWLQEKSKLLSEMSATQVARWWLFSCLQWHIDKDWQSNQIKSSGFWNNLNRWT